MATQAQTVLSEAVSGAAADVAQSADQQFINEQLDWLKVQHDDVGISWPVLGHAIGIPKGTISQLLGPNSGSFNLQKFAEIISNYRATTAAQEELAADLPEKPEYFETPTSMAITHYLRWAQRGRMVLIVSGAGLGKTETAKKFLRDNTNSWLATMTPSTSGIMPMQQRVLRSLGEKHVIGAPAALSEMICEKLAGRTHSVLMIDEAQHLSIKALEEIRSWHDETGVGIAVMGNERVQQSIDGVSRAADFAQIFSRVGLRLVRGKAVAGDAEALAAAWGIEDPKIIEFVREIAGKPGALRGATFALEVAHMLAVAQGGKLTLAHVKKAWSQNSAKAM